MNLIFNFSKICFNFIQIFYLFYFYIKNMQFIQKKSFSKYGSQLELEKKPANNVQGFNRKKLLELKIGEKLLKKQSYEKKHIASHAPLETISRQKLSPFTLFHSKDYYKNLDYRINHKIVEKDDTKYTVMKAEKICYFDKIANKGYQPQSIAATKQDRNLIVSDFQNHRKQLHHFDFSKQPRRILTSASGSKFMHERDSEVRFNNFEQQSMKRKSFSVHSFTSYPARPQLFRETNKKNLLNPSVKNLNDINFGLIKKRWSTGNLVKFQHIAKTTMVRTDRDSIPWVTKLDYEISKDKLKHSNSQPLKFALQTARKFNEVHSKYPLRICL